MGDFNRKGTSVSKIMTYDRYNTIKTNSTIGCGDNTKPITNLYVKVDAGSYKFYTDQTVTNLLQPTNTLCLGTKYRFQVVTSVTDFYIGDQGYKNSSSSSIIISGDGSPTAGISADESFILKFNLSATTSMILKYYSTSNPNMIGTFTINT